MQRTVAEVIAGKHRALCNEQKRTVRVDIHIAEITFTFIRQRANVTVRHAVMMPNGDTRDD